MDKDKLANLIAQLLPPVDAASRPTLNSLHMALRDLDAIKINIKNNGYLLAQTLAAALPKRSGLHPRAIDYASKPTTQADIESDWCAYWLSVLGLPVLYHRKLWEFAYVLQFLWQSDMLTAGRRGIGFGCGSEPLPSLLASYGVDVLVTDLAPEAQADKGWVETNQHTHSLDAVYLPSLVSREAFERHVSLKYVDMNRIPADLRGFDFCWSICAFEHLGSIAKGLDFVENSLETLKPHGVAIHTTEFNFANDDATLDNWPTVLFQRKHFQALHDRLVAKGHWVAPLDFDVGQAPVDLFIDVPPYSHDWTESQKAMWPNSAHLKLSIDGFPATCFGLVIRKGAA